MDCVAVEMDCIAAFTSGRGISDNKFSIPLCKYRLECMAEIFDILFQNLKNVNFLTKKVFLDLQNAVHYLSVGSKFSLLCGSKKIPMPKMQEIRNNWWGG